MAYQPGDVVLVPFPLSDLSTVKVRPAVIVSSIRYQASEPDVIVAATTPGAQARSRRSQSRRRGGMPNCVISIRINSVNPIWCVGK